MTIKKPATSSMTPSEELRASPEVFILESNLQSIINNDNIEKSTPEGLGVPHVHSVADMILFNTSYVYYFYCFIHFFYYFLFV